MVDASGVKQAVAQKNDPHGWCEPSPLILFVLGDFSGLRLRSQVCMSSPPGATRPYVTISIAAAITIPRTRIPISLTEPRLLPGIVPYRGGDWWLDLDAVDSGAHDGVDNVDD